MLWVTTPSRLRGTSNEVRGHLHECPAVALLPSGDAINHPAQLREPGLATGPDDDVEVALRARRRLIGELVDSGRVLAPPHFAEPFGRLVSEAPAGCRWREVLRPTSTSTVTFPGRVLS
jgi:hypothetical protein